MNLPDMGVFSIISAPYQHEPHILSLGLSLSPIIFRFRDSQLDLSSMRLCQIVGISLHTCGEHVLKNKSLFLSSLQLSGNPEEEQIILTQCIKVQVNGGESPGPWKRTNFSETVACRADIWSQP
jgi:hypothetical protein